MIQTFIKTINGHNLEFNRLLYPVRYLVISHDEKYMGTRLEITREKEDNWTENKTQRVPACFDSIITDICNVIKNNETRTTVNSVY